MYYIFCNLHIIYFAIRYCENSHGISKYTSFRTYRMTLKLHNRHFFPQTNRGNSYGILKFKPFATCSINFWFPGPLTFSSVFNLNVWTLESHESRFFFYLHIFFTTMKSWKSLWNFKIHIICNVVLFFFGIACTNECYFGIFLKNNNKNTLISTRKFGTNSKFLIQFQVMRSSSKKIYYYNLLLG